MIINPFPITQWEHCPYSEYEAIEGKELTYFQSQIDGEINIPLKEIVSILAADTPMSQPSVTIIRDRAGRIFYYPFSLIETFRHITLLCWEDIK